MAGKGSGGKSEKSGDDLAKKVKVLESKVAHLEVLEGKVAHLENHLAAFLNGLSDNFGKEYVQKFLEEH